MASQSHDAHALPPASMKDLFKQRRKQSLASIESEPGIIDPRSPSPALVTFLAPSDQIPKAALQDLELKFAKGADAPDLLQTDDTRLPEAAFEINALPGLYVFPSLVTPQLQIALLEKLLHRDLSNPVHKTNLHLHYDVEYPAPRGKVDGSDDVSSSSFFSADRQASLVPKDPAVHRPITYRQVLDSKLRWMTLGGQYDWTHKIYPNEVPPVFPPDIAVLLKTLFPTVDAQAAIVNFYSPGDTLSVHRDVSEDCDRDLISISIGCDGIFLAGNDDGTEVATVRLRSGDGILMSGRSRYAWHAVPKIVAGTCPPWLQAWPDISNGHKYQEWHGWMKNKRINLNVRQMKER